MASDTNVDDVVPLGTRWLPRRPPGEFHCPVCAVDFTRKCDLLRHINSSVSHQHRREAKSLHGCPQCGKTFLTKATMRHHFQGQHSVFN
jgi:uncharacterized C2H2 Zn-finger protein